MLTSDVLSHPLGGPPLGVELQDVVLVIEALRHQGRGLPVLEDVEAASKVGH